ncbi:MAG TPA: hypothetical protein VIT44_09310 [Cyclobacteriaceae bacterium]
MKTLKTVLLINALSSGVTGLGLIISSSLVAQLFGVSATGPFIEVGIFLLAFASLVLFVGRGETHHVNAVRFIIALDLLWVIISLVIVLLHLFDLSVLGYLLISGVALWVGAMAYLQSAGLKQLTSN